MYMYLLYMEFGQFRLSEHTTVYCAFLNQEHIAVVDPPRVTTPYLNSFSTLHVYIHSSSNVRLHIHVHTYRGTII